MTRTYMVADSDNGGAPEAFETFDAEDAAKEYHEKYFADMDYASSLLLEVTDSDGGVTRWKTEAEPATSFTARQVKKK